LHTLSREPTLWSLTNSPNTIIHGDRTTFKLLEIRWNSLCERFP